MPVKYACFISYRHSQHELVKSFIEKFTNALMGHVEGWVEEEVYIDEKRLKGGDFLDPSVAKAICQSACLIVIFTPRYFHKNHPWCAREFIAMRRLQTQRFSCLDLDGNERQFSMIIPIILRAKEEIIHPDFENIIYYDFNQWNLCNPNISSDPRYVDWIEEIAQRVSMILGILKEYEFVCNDFELPAEDDPEVLEVLNKARPYIPPPFPGRAKK